MVGSVLGRKYIKLVNAFSGFVPMALNHFGFLSAAPSTVKVETRSLASDDIDLTMLVSGRATFGLTRR